RGGEKRRCRPEGRRYTSREGGGSDENSDTGGGDGRGDSGAGVRRRSAEQFAKWGAGTRRQGRSDADCAGRRARGGRAAHSRLREEDGIQGEGHVRLGRDRKSTRLNSSHGSISYAVFCLKKKIQKIDTIESI